MEQLTLWKVFLTIIGSTIAAIFTNYLIQFMKNALERQNVLITAIEMYRGMLKANYDVISFVLDNSPPDETFISLNVYSEFDTIFSKLNIEVLFRYDPDIATNILYMKILTGTLSSIHGNSIPKERFPEYLLTSQLAIEKYTELLESIHKISRLQWIYLDFLNLHNKE